MKEGKDVSRGFKSPLKKGGSGEGFRVRVLESPKNTKIGRAHV